MAKPDLSGLSVSELEELRTELDTLIETKRAGEAARLAEELQEKAAAAGVDVDAVLANLTGKKRRAKAQPKYQHPTNQKLTWTGRGKKPKWIVELLDQGKSLESLEIG